FARCHAGRWEEWWEPIEWFEGASMAAATRVRIRSELGDEPPGFGGVPARRLTGISRLPSVRAVEDAVLGRVTRGAAFVDRAFVRLARGWEVRGRGLRCAAVDRGELRLFHAPAGRRGIAGAVLASLRGIV